MGLVYCYGQRRPPPPKAQEDSTILSAPPTVISNLIKCVSSTKEYLDSFFAIPPTEHNSLPFSAWYQVIFTVFVLYRLSVGLPEVPEWNVKIAQQTVDLQGYFDTLLSHLQAIKPSSDRQIPTKSLFSRLSEIIGSVKTSYALAKIPHKFVIVAMLITSLRLRITQPHPFKGCTAVLHCGIRAATWPRLRVNPHYKMPLLWKSRG